jgi:hypothetical protein
MTMWGKRGQLAGQLIRQMNHRAMPLGQSLLELAILFSAVAMAMVLMSNYVRRSFNAHAEVLERQLNTATEDNQP